MASFLSRLNTRRDGYGGSRENRARLPLEVLAAVRVRAGEDYVVGIRYLGEEAIEGGSDLDDAVWFGVRFAGAGVDYLSVSKGGRFEDAKQPKVGQAVYPYTGRSGFECMPPVTSDERGPFGRNIPLAAAIKRAVNEAGYATPNIFICAQTPDTPAPGSSPKARGNNLERGGHLSYIYIGQNLDENSPDDAVLVYEKLGNHGNQGTNVLFKDGHVQWYDAKQTATLMSELGAGHNPPQKKVAGEE